MSRFLSLLRCRGYFLRQSNLKIASNISLPTTSRCALLVTALLIKLGLTSTLKYEYSRFSTLGKKVNLHLCLCSSFKIVLPVVLAYRCEMYKKRNRKVLVLTKFFFRFLTHEQADTHGETFRRFRINFKRKSNTLN